MSQRFQMSDLLRSRGQIRISGMSEEPAQGLGDLQSAYEIAKINGNKLYELRAAAALSEVLQSDGVGSHVPA